MPVDVAVVIPGVMGSCLEYTQSGKSEPIWTECFHDNYKRLAQQSAVFQYNGTAASAPRILKFAYVRDILLWGQFWRTDLFDALLTHLSSHRDFNHSPGGVIEFPYDWRESLTETARKLGDFLENLGMPVRSPSQFRLSLITHSMGGLVARIALVDNQIHYQNVRRIVHIAPPLMGSARAFRSLFGGNALPFLDGFVTYCYSRKNGSLALENLQRVMASFPSIYQLMPPLLEKFLYAGTGADINPLDVGQSVISPHLRKEAWSIHDKIFDSIDMIKNWKIPVYTIYGNNGSVVTDKRYKVFIEPNRYKMLSPVPYEDSPGDATVTTDSVSYDGRERSDLREVVGEEHAYMCNSLNVIRVLGAIL